MAKKYGYTFTGVGRNTRKGLTVKNLITELIYAREKMDEVWDMMSLMASYGFLDEDTYFKVCVEAGSWAYHDDIIEEMDSGKVIFDFNSIMDKVCGSEYMRTELENIETKEW